MPPPEPRRVFIVAGEVSGDLHGASLARELRALDPSLRVEGIGGRAMAAVGVRLVEDSSAWGVLGWAEAARHLLAFLRRLNAATAHLRAAPPDVLVPIDFPGFNLALLRRLRGRLPAAYYVPPMVSVRRGGRAQRVAALGARLLAIFPFEAEAYRRAGADVTFVGHPAVDLVEDGQTPERVRARLGIAPGAPVLGLLPGSRAQEMDRLLAPMLGAAQLLRAAQPDLVLLLGVASSVFRGRIEAAVAACGLPVVLRDGAAEVLRASTALLAASGTVTVEAMVLGTPMVVAYRASWLTWAFAHLAASVRRAALPNIMAGEDIVPEFLQDQVAPAVLAEAVRPLLTDAAARDLMRARLRRLAEALGPPGAARRAAIEVIRMIGVRNLNAHAAVQ